MKLNITMAIPDWDPNPDKTITQNHNWRRCVIVQFPNCSFKWIPTYEQLEEIKKALNDCEMLNKTLAQKHYYGRE